MIHATQVLSDVKAQPFRPFRLHRTGGKTYDVRHPEMIKVGNSFLLVFSYVAAGPEILDTWKAFR